jgi:hypothetical protein
MPRTTDSNPQLDQRAYEMRLSGSTLPQIAEALGLRHPFRAVTRHARANGLADPANRRSAREASRFARSAGLAFDPEQFAAVQATSVVSEAGGAFISARTFGVEIEFTRSSRPVRASVADIRAALIAEGIAVYDGGEHFYAHTVMPEWKIVYDASTDLEVVSPVLSGIDGLRQVRTVMSVLRRFGKATNRDGAHVHLYAGDLTPMTIYRIVEFYTLRQSAIDTLMPPSRRNGRWAQAFTSSTLRAVRRYAETGQVHAPFGRYATVNLECFHRQQTIEFRQAAGTLVGRKSNDWVEFLLALVSHVEQNETTDCPLDLHGMLDALVSGRYLKRATARRLEARAASFGNPRPSDHTPTPAPTPETPSVPVQSEHVLAENQAPYGSSIDVFADGCSGCRRLVRAAFTRRAFDNVLVIHDADDRCVARVRETVSLDVLRMLDVPDYIVSIASDVLAPF